MASTAHLFRRGGCQRQGSLSCTSIQDGDRACEGAGRALPRSTQEARRRGQGGDGQPAEQGGNFEQSEHGGDSNGLTGQDVDIDDQNTIELVQAYSALETEVLPDADLSGNAKGQAALSEARTIACRGDVEAHADVVADVNNAAGY